MKDELGEYEPYEIPRELVLPLHLDERNDAIVGDDNRIICSYFTTNETVPRLYSKRRSEYVMRLANGEIVHHEGKIYVRAEHLTHKDQDGTLVMKYKPASVAVEV